MATLTMQNPMQEVDAVQQKLREVVDRTGTDLQAIEGNADLADEGKARQRVDLVTKRQTELDGLRKAEAAAIAGAREFIRSTAMPPPEARFGVAEQRTADALERLDRRDQLRPFSPAVLGLILERAAATDLTTERTVRDLIMGQVASLGERMVPQDGELRPGPELQGPVEAQERFFGAGVAFGPSGATGDLWPVLAQIARREESRLSPERLAAIQAIRAGHHRARTLDLALYIDRMADPAKRDFARRHLADPGSGLRRLKP